MKLSPWLTGISGPTITISIAKLDGAIDLNNIRLNIVLSHLEIELYG